MATNQSTNNTYVVPNLAEFISRRMRDISARINCHTVGSIVSFDPTNQTAVVNISLLKVLQGVNPIGETGNSSDEVVSYPQLVDVPVIIMNGGGGRLTFPIAAGDTCLILFCDRDIDSWFNAGLTAVPNSGRVHDINDAICLVGLYNLPDKLTDYNASELEIKFSTGLITVNDRTGERLAQSGDLKATARSTAPSGWLLCYGQSLATASYPDLFAAIGYTYGGSGANFNVPDLRGRIPVGLDNMGGSNANVLTNAFNPNRNTLGGDIGEESHQLVISEIPSHHHYNGMADDQTVLFVYGPTTTDMPGLATATIASEGNSRTYQGLTSNTGGDGAHQNVQPGMMVNWVIKI